MNSTTFIRNKKSRNYTVIDNTFLKDTRLSMQAKGLFCYLLSLPEDWIIYQSEIANHFANSIGAVKKTIKELESFGYLKITRILNTDGKKGYKTSYTIIENPMEEEKEINNSNENKGSENEKVSTFFYSQNSTVEISTVEKRPLLNTNKQNTNNTNSSSPHIKNSSPTSITPQNKNSSLSSTKSSSFTNMTKPTKISTSSSQYSSQNKNTDTNKTKSLQINSSEHNHFDLPDKSFTAVTSVTEQKKKFPNEWYSQCLNKYKDNYKSVTHSEYPNFNKLIVKFKGCLKKQFEQGFTPDDICTVFDNAMKDQFIINKTGYKMTAMFGSLFPNLLSGKTTNAITPGYQTSRKQSATDKYGIQGKEAFTGEATW